MKIAKKSWPSALSCFVIVVVRDTQPTGLTAWAMLSTPSLRVCTCQLKHRMPPLFYGNIYT